MDEMLDVDDVVTIDGKQYSRSMAEQMVLDIELVDALRPGVWAIGDNSALTIGNVTFLSFALPIHHGYLIDSTDADGDVLSAIEAYGRPAGLTMQPELVRLTLPNHEPREILKTVRAAHESAIRKNLSFFKRCMFWKWHNFEVAQTLSEVVGRVLPEPSYADELLELRAKEEQTPDLSAQDGVSGLDLGLLHHIAHDIEVAHEANPNSWAFYRIKAGGVVLIVEGITVLHLTKSGGGLMVLGDLDDPALRTGTPSGAKKRYKNFPGFWVGASSVSQLEHLVTELATQHHKGIIELANRVKTRAQRATEHQPQTLNTLSELVGRELPSPAYVTPNPGKQYWKISPGEGGKYWSVFRDRSFVAMHWGDTPADLSDYPAEKQAFTAKVKAELDVSPQGAASLWDFARVMQANDEVLAYANKTVLGYGTVTGDYQLVEDDFEYPHRRSVAWRPLAARPVAPLPEPLQRKLKTVATLVDLTEEEYMEATGQHPRPSDFSPVDVVHTQFAASGLHYSRNQVAAFYTALQTKGFVVVTGISGTGKSKIATGFVEMLPVPAAAAIPKRDNYGLLPIIVKRYMKESRRIVIPVRYYELLTPMERGGSYQLPVSINGKQGTGRLWFRIHGGRDQYLLSFHQILSSEINEWSEGQHIYLDIVLNPEGDKVLEIHITDDQPEAGSDESGSPVTNADSKNYLFLTVRPDWRDSTSLFGYYNPLMQTYEWTEFLRFVIRAQESFSAGDGLAWFVILDEMNLAHVEYYFADLLSVIESGRDQDGWTREPIRLTYPLTLDDDAPPQELKLPPNLYIIGTVNMDETTHSFSPKVLDRAFTIELSEVDFLGYQLTGVSSDTGLQERDKRRLLDAFTRYDSLTGQRGFARISKSEVAAIIEQEPEIRQLLHSLNNLLQNHRFHFGYRVFDEIAQYLYNNRENEAVDFMTAFDQAVFMKVLPKYSGSRARLRGPLLALLTWALHPENPELSMKSVQEKFLALDSDDPIAIVAFTEDAAFKPVAARTLQMLITLEQDGFVSFG